MHAASHKSFRGLSRMGSQIGRRAAIAGGLTGAAMTRRARAHAPKPVRVAEINDRKAAIYSSTLPYLRAAQKAGTTDTKTALATKKALPISEMFTPDGHTGKQQDDLRRASDAGEKAGGIQIPLGLYDGDSNDPG